MPNTFQILSLWDKGQAFAERMAAKLLMLEGYSKIDPQVPNGGPDGKKDIICYKAGTKIVAGCYFPSEQRTFKKIKDKFNDDYLGVARNNSKGFVFITNQKITPNERMLLAGNRIEIDIYHGERVCGLLDSPKGYGIRLEYLGIELSREEQISFLNSHLDLSSRFSEISDKIDKIYKHTTSMMAMVDRRDSQNRWSTVPVAGIAASSRLCVEDIFSLHIACMYDAGSPAHIQFGAFRRIEVWIGKVGGSKVDADFVAVAPDKVPEMTHALIEWWRRQYEIIVHGGEPQKIRVIAEFHARFLTIHPFIDGNGRVARALATIQFRDLLSKDVSFAKIDDKESYYESLQHAQQSGNYGFLITHLNSLME